VIAKVNLFPDDEHCTNSFGKPTGPDLIPLRAV
jgi:hypothetical protein